MLDVDCVLTVARMQAGAQAAAGVFLGASMIAAIAAMFLPMETVGMALAEDVDDMYPRGPQPSNPSRSKEAPEQAQSAPMAQITVNQGNTVDTVNPFTTGNLGQNAQVKGTAGKYQDQYGLETSIEQ
jgi:hypothetical protein